MAIIMLLPLSSGRRMGGASLQWMIHHDSLQLQGQPLSQPVRRAYALVLGITDYHPAVDADTEHDANVTTYDPLLCCVNDARFMRENLLDIGFQVEIWENLSGIGIKQKVATFVERHKRAARVDGGHGAEFLLYFSGHGFASAKGSPHVVGTDANKPGAQAVNLKKDFVCPLDKCCDGAAILLLVDACMVAPDALADDKERTTRLNSRGNPEGEVLKAQHFRDACEQERANGGSAQPSAAPGMAPYVPAPDASATPCPKDEDAAAAASPPDPLDSSSGGAEQPPDSSRNNVTVTVAAKQDSFENTQLAAAQLSAPRSLSNPTAHSSSLYIVDTTLSNEVSTEPPDAARHGSSTAQQPPVPSAHAISQPSFPNMSSDFAACQSLQDTTQFDSATETISIHSGVTFSQTVSDVAPSRSLAVRAAKDTGAVLATSADGDSQRGMHVPGHNRQQAASDDTGSTQAAADQQLPCINDMFAVASSNSELPRRLQQTGTTDTSSIAAASRAVIPPHSCSSSEVGVPISGHNTVSVDSCAACQQQKTAETAASQQQQHNTENDASEQLSRLYTPPDPIEDSIELDATLSVSRDLVGVETPVNDAERSTLTGASSMANRYASPSPPLGAACSLPAYRSEPLGGAEVPACSVQQSGNDVSDAAHVPAYTLQHAGAASTPVHTTQPSTQNGERADRRSGSLSNWAAFEGAHMGHAAPLKPPAPDATQRLSVSGQDALSRDVQVRGPSGARFEPPSGISEGEPSSDIAPTVPIVQHAALVAGAQEPIYAVGYPPAMSLDQEDRSRQDTAAAGAGLVACAPGSLRMKSAAGTLREKGSYGKVPRAKTKTNMIVVSYPCGLGAPALEGEVMSLWTKVLVKHLHTPMSITALLEVAGASLHKQGQRPWMHFTPGFKAYSLAKGWLNGEAEHVQADEGMNIEIPNKALPAAQQPSAPPPVGLTASTSATSAATAAASTAVPAPQALRDMAAATQDHLRGLAHVLDRSNESEADFKFLIERFDSLERRVRKQQEQQSVLLQSFSLEHGMQHLTLTHELNSSSVVPSTPLANVESSPSPCAAPAGAAALLSSPMPSSSMLDDALSAPPAATSAPAAAATADAAALDVAAAPKAAAAAAAARAQPESVESAAGAAEAPAAPAADAPAPAATVAAAAAAAEAPVAAAAAAAAAAPVATRTASAAESTATTPAAKPVPLVQAAQALLQRPSHHPVEAVSAPLLVTRYMPSRTEVATPFDNPDISGGANAVQAWAQDSLYTLNETSSSVAEGVGNHTGAGFNPNARHDLEQTFPDFRAGLSHTTQSSTPPSQLDTPPDTFQTQHAHSMTTSSQTSLKTSFGVSEPAPVAQQAAAQDTTPSNDGELIVEPPVPVAPTNGAAALDKPSGVNSRRAHRTGKTSGTVHSLDTLCNVVSKYSSAVGRAAASQPPSSTAGGRTRAPGPFVINLKNRSLSVDGTAQRHQRLPEEIQPREERFAATPRFTSQGSMALGTPDAARKSAYSCAEPSSTGTTTSSTSRPGSPPTVQIMSNSVSSLSAISRRPMVHLQRRGSFSIEPSGPRTTGTAPRRLPGASEYGAGSDSDSALPSHCFWSLSEMPQNACCWSICGSGKIMHGSIELPEGSFLFLGSGKTGRSPLYLDGMSIKGGTVVLLKGAKSVIMHKCKFGSPLIALDGANAQFEACALEGGHTGVGVFASGAATSVNMSACRIRYFEECVVVEKGAQVTLSRSTLSYASLAGVEVRGREIPMHGAHALGFGSQAPEGLAPMQEHPADLSQPFPMTPAAQSASSRAGQQQLGSEAKAVVSLMLAENCLFTDMHGSSTWDTSCVWAHAGGAVVLKESAIKGGVWGVCAQGAGTSAHVDGGEMGYPREGGVLVQGGACASVHCCKIFMHELHAQLPMLESATGSIVGTSHKTEEHTNNNSNNAARRTSSTQAAAQSQASTGRVEFDACMLPIMSRPKSSSAGARASTSAGDQAPPTGPSEGWKTAWGAVMHGACGSVVSGNGFLDLDGCEISGGECGALLEKSGAHAKISRTVVQHARSACIWANEKCTVKAQESYLLSSVKGHGLWVSGDGATGTLKNCVIEKHAGCGVLCEGSHHASVTAKECESRSNQECGFKAVSGAEIRLEQCISSDEVQKMQLGGRVSGSSRSAFSWLREQLHAGVASRGGWLANRIHTSRRNNA